MFIYSLRASTLKFFAVVCVALTTLITLIAFIPEYNGENTGSLLTANEVEINFDKIKTNEDRLEFLRQFGWEVVAEPKACVEVKIPEEFDKVFTGYNEIQKRQGLDLSKYKNKNVMRYTYEVTNYDDDGVVYANILIYRNRVIGGDICSADVTGFIHGLEKK